MNKPADEKFLAALTFLRVLINTNLPAAIKQGLALAAKVERSANLELKSDVFHAIGLAHHEARKFDEALHWYSLALDLRRLDRNKIGESKTLNNIGLVYFDTGKYKEAIPFFMQTIELKLELKELKSLTATYQNLGGAFEKLSEFKKAIAVYFKSLKISEQLGDIQRIADTYQNIGIIYQTRDDSKQALEWYLKARKLLTDTDSKHTLARLNNNIAGALLSLKKYTEALKYSQLSLQESEALGYIPVILAASSNIGHTLKALGRLKEALAILEKALSLATTEKEYLEMCNVLTTMGEIQILAADHAAAEQLLLQALPLARKMKSKSNEARICLLLSKFYEAMRKPMAALKYYKQYDASKGAITKAEIANRMNQLQTQYEVAKKEEELLKARSLQVESELKALRAQMDPHFIFNSLNTMRKELLEGNIDKADQYIVRFSRLLRLILDTTRTPSVKLRDNLELLHLYIQIEQGRQAMGFTYRIHVAPGISPDNIYVPGMVLQPLVENAIVHGLFHKQDGNGKLYVGFSKAGNTLKIKVTDNGVGRKQSSAARAPGHTSHATSIIRETLTLAWKDKMKDRYFSIKDKTDAQGQPAGTEVTVLLPFAYY